MDAAIQKTKNTEFDVITIGGATLDLFIKSDESKIISLRESDYQHDYLAYEYGRKIYLDALYYMPGGGGNNTAISFARLGLRTAFIACIGQDEEGRSILKNLKSERVRTDFITRLTGQQTGVSVILNSFEGDRTVFSFRGSNNALSEAMIPWDQLSRSAWLYMPSLSGEADGLIDTLADFTAAHQVRLACNPGTAQLQRGLKGLAKMLNHTDVLILNKKEAELLTGKKARHLTVDESLCPIEVMHGEPWISNLRDIMAEIHGAGVKQVVVTEGIKGSQAYDGKDFFWMPVYPFAATDTLGAGDAFASAYVAAQAQGRGVETGLKYGAANSALVVQQIGSIPGLGNPRQIEAMIDAHRDIVPVRIYTPHV
jgi:ribokinase